MWLECNYSSVGDHQRRSLTLEHLYGSLCVFLRLRCSTELYTLIGLVASFCAPSSNAEPVNVILSKFKPTCWCWGLAGGSGPALGADTAKSIDLICTRSSVGTR